MSAPDSLFPPAPGATISEIVPLPSDPSVRSVRVDGRTVARLGEAAIETLGLTPGRPWTPDLAAAVERAITGTKAERAALAMLGRRGLTRREVADRLAARGFGADIAASVTDALVEQGWLDDEAVARQLVDEARARRPAARVRLAQQLETRGVAPDLAARVLDEMLGDVDPFDEALRVAEKHLRGQATDDRLRAGRRVAAALARRGFDEDVTGRVLDRLGLHPDP